MSAQCEFTDGSARCVFGPDHTVDYHHLDDGRNVPAAQQSALDRLPLRFEQEAARQLDVALGFPDSPAVAAKCRGKAIAFACAADWLRDALALVRDTKRCIVHDETYTTVCRGCRADEIAVTEETA